MRDSQVEQIAADMNELIERIEAFAERMLAEQEAAGDGEQELKRLLGIQVRKGRELAALLDGRPVELLLDIVDRSHVVDEARHGRFV